MHRITKDVKVASIFGKFNILLEKESLARIFYGFFLLDHFIEQVRLSFNGIISLIMVCSQ